MAEIAEEANTLHTSNGNQLDESRTQNPQGPDLSGLKDGDRIPGHPGFIVRNVGGRLLPGQTF